jgi:hypothetical protein
LDKTVRTPDNLDSRAYPLKNGLPVTLHPDMLVTMVGWKMKLAPEQQ